jgi:hypothetical protein
MNDLNGLPLACVACYRLHRHHKHAMTELVRYVILGIYTSQLLQHEVPVDEPVVLLQCLLLHQ